MATKRTTTFMVAALAVVLAAVTPGAAQEAYPARVVTLVVPAAAGSTTDTLARLLADRLNQS